MNTRRREKAADERRQRVTTALALTQPRELADAAFRDSSILSTASEEELKNLWGTAERLQFAAIEMRSAIAAELRTRYAGFGEAWSRKAAKVLGTGWRRVYESISLYDAFNKRPEDLPLLGTRLAIICAESGDPRAAVEHAARERSAGRKATAIEVEIRRLFAGPRSRRRFRFGPPLHFRNLRYEPVDEQGVVFLFGLVAKELGFEVEGVRGSFPDCRAKRKTSPAYLEDVNIEFEFRSYTFWQSHGHEVEGCDLIVCWEHNWPECPLPVLELKSAIKQLPADV